MGNNSTLVHGLRLGVSGLFILGIAGLAWGLASTEAPQIASMPFEADGSSLGAGVAELTVAALDPTEIPAAPGGARPTEGAADGGAAMGLGRDELSPAAGRQELLVYCSSASHRLIAARLERSFELSEPRIDLVLRVDTERNCVGHLLMGTADVAMIGSDLSQRERDHGLTQQVLGYRIMVPIVHPDNPVDNLAYDDMRAVLEGRMTSWIRVGGAKLSIEPVCKPPSSQPELGTGGLHFHQRLAGTTVFMHSFGEIIGYVSNSPRTLGLVSSTSVDAVRIVKTLQVGHVPPKREFFKSGAWRFGTTFRAIAPRRPDAATTAWLSYLQSSQARLVIRRVMVLPD